MNINNGVVKTLQTADHKAITAHLYAHNTHQKIKGERYIYAHLPLILSLYALKH